MKRALQALSLEPGAWSLSASKIGHGPCHPPPSATINRTFALI
jgi:hypothetical protein